MEDQAASELRSKLNKLIDKEIGYRNYLLQNLTHQGYIKIFPKYIKDLIELKKFGNGNYNSFRQYYDQIRRLQPNYNGSPVNKTISNLETKYSNKNKYPN